MSKEDRTFTLGAFRFFKEHGAMSYNPATETPAEGKVRCAIEYARAELTGTEWGATFEWMDDDNPDTSWMDAETLAEYRRGGTRLMGCVLYLPTEDTPVESLWGIHVRSPYWTDPYKRVVEAELMEQAIHEHVKAES